MSWGRSGRTRSTSSGTPSGDWGAGTSTLLRRLYTQLVYQAENFSATICAHSRRVVERRQA